MLRAMPARSARGVQPDRRGVAPRRRTGTADDEQPVAPRRTQRTAHALARTHAVACADTDGTRPARGRASAWRTAPARGRGAEAQHTASRSGHVLGDVDNGTPRVRPRGMGRARRGQQARGGERRAKPRRSPRARGATNGPETAPAPGCTEDAKRARGAPSPG